MFESYLFTVLIIIRQVFWYYFRKHKNPAEKSLEDNSRNVTDSSFKEFDSEIVDCVMQDVKEVRTVFLIIRYTVWDQRNN